MAKGITVKTFDEGRISNKVSLNLAGSIAQGRVPVSVKEYVVEGFDPDR